MIESKDCESAFDGYLLDIDESSNSPDRLTAIAKNGDSHTSYSNVLPLPPPPDEDDQTQIEEIAQNKSNELKQRNKNQAKAKVAIRWFIELPAFGLMVFLIAWSLLQFGIIPVFCAKRLLLNSLTYRLFLTNINLRHWLLSPYPLIYPSLITASACAFYSYLIQRSSNSLSRQITCRIGSLSWDRNSFCRGWLITGATGTGKTARALMKLFHEVFIHEAGKLKGASPGNASNIVNHDSSSLSFSVEQSQNEVAYDIYPWGGICIDEKGLFYQQLLKLCKYYNREHHLMLLQTRPEFAPPNWKPIARLNLLSDDRIPASTYARNIVKTAQAVQGGKAEKDVFFTTQSQIQIGWAIALCRAISTRQKELYGLKLNECYRPSLRRIAQLLGSRDVYNQALLDCGVQKDGGLIKVMKGGSEIEIPKRTAGPLLEGIDKDRQSWPESLRKLQDCLHHFERSYWNLPGPTHGSIQGNITNCLNYFTDDEVAEVFCTDNTFDFNDIDKGLIVCISMPQKLKTERQYVCTLLKLLFYTHVLRRFDQNQESLKNKNLLICWADECQRFIDESDGNVDVIREAGATLIAATQSKTSLVPPLGGKERANVTTLNLRNRIVFRAADEECAIMSADFLGKHKKTKITTTSGKSGRSRSRTSEIAYLIEPYEFRKLKDGEAILCHANGIYKKMEIKPLEADGTISPWYKSSWFS